MVMGVCSDTGGVYAEQEEEDDGWGSVDGRKMGAEAERGEDMGSGRDEDNGEVAGDNGDEDEEEDEDEDGTSEGV